MNARSPFNGVFFTVEMDIVHNAHKNAVPIKQDFNSLVYSVP